MKIFSFVLGKKRMKSCECMGIKSGASIVRTGAPSLNDLFEFQN